jgi:hypothetical protein
MFKPYLHLSFSKVCVDTLLVLWIGRLASSLLFRWYVPALAHRFKFGNSWIPVCLTIYSYTNICCSFFIQWKGVTGATCCYRNMCCWLVNIILSCLAQKEWGHSARPPALCIFRLYQELAGYAPSTLLLPNTQSRPYTIRVWSYETLIVSKTAGI